MNINILDFGAKANSNELCTEAIQKAIDTCFENGGGTVNIPSGKFLTGTIWLRSNVELHLCHGAILKASENLADYNDEDAYEQNFSCRESEEWVGKHLLIAHECENVALTGSGTIDGSGDSFYSDELTFCTYAWKDGIQLAKDKELCRPGQLLCFIECSRVRVENITMTNQPCWGCFLYGCEYVQVRGIKSINPTTAFNSDGIDIDSCRYVTVSDCIFDTGDDAIAIRGAEELMKNRPHPCEYVTISNCVLGSASSAIRIGVGTGLIRHIRISNITITRASPAINFMTTYNSYGDVSIEDVSIVNVSAVDSTRGMEIIQGGDAYVRRITVENFYVETDGYFKLQADCPHSVSDIVLRNCRIVQTGALKAVNPRQVDRRGTSWFRAKNIDNLKLENVQIEDEGDYLSTWKDGVFSFDDCSSTQLNNVTLNGKELL